MTVKQIALSAAAILQADDIEEAIKNTDREDADVITLVKCVNLAAAEMFDDFPVTHTVTLRSSNGIIPYENFGDMPSVVYRVEHNGYAVPFSFGSRGVCVVRDGTYNVTYASEIVEADIDDDIRLGAGADSDALVYLTVRNYCLVTGRTDEAAIWDQRYNAEIEKKRIARRARLPRRAWL